MEMKKDTSWGKVSNWYDEYLEKDNTFQSRVILPNLLRLLNIKKGTNVLDLACGQGYFSEAFIRAGASVIGVDISPELISVAKEKVKGAQFFASPAHKLLFIKTESVDEVVIILAIQNIENISEVFREVKRVLKPQGKFFLVLNHPAFRIPGASAWGFDEAENIQYRRIDSYMTESKHEIDMHPGSKGKKEITVSFHRPLQVYFKTLANAGFAVTRLEEWNSHRESEPGLRKKSEDKARKEFPMFLYLEMKSI